MKEGTRSFYRAAVERTVEQIARRLDEALDLAALARAAGLAPFHFHRMFRGMVGETPLEMHRRLRLERAARELAAGEAAVTTIAFGSGYDTHEAFTRAFRQAHGISPSAFRKEAAEARAGCTRPRQWELAAPSGVHFGFGEAGGEAASPARIHFMKGGVDMDVIIENLSELRVAAVPHLGPYARISEAFARLGAIAGPAGLFQFPEAWMVAVYHDDPETTPADQLRSDAGITIATDVALPEGLVERRLAAGRYARTTHVGPYSGLGDAWSRFMGGWLPESGHRVGEGQSFEVYRNTPMDTPPEALRTDLYLPLAGSG